MGKITKIPEHINKRIVELRLDGAVIREIKDKLFEELDTKVSMGYIAKVCKQLKETGGVIDKGLSELNKVVEDDNFYEVQNDFYIFYKDGEKFPVPVKTIDDIFKDYSKHGSNMIGDEIISKYKLKSEVWSLIKGRLKLYKTSNIISPYTLENMTEEQADAYIEDGINITIQDKYKATFERKHKAIKDREFKKYSNYYNQQQEFLGELEKVLKLYRPQKLSKQELRKIPKLENEDTIDVGFSDLHLGKMGTDGVVSRIYKLTNTLIQRPEKNVNLLFLGDVAETLIEGGFHSGQIESMDGVYGFDLMMLVVKVIETMLLDLYKAGKNITFYGVGGNHGRNMPHHDQDQQRTAELVIYEMISRGVSDTEIQVNILREKINVLYLENFNFVVHHGDAGFASKADKNSEKILWNNIKKNKNKKSIVMYGDRHNINIGEGKDYTTIGLPALAGQNEYDKRIDVHSAPGFVIIEKNQDGDPDISIKRLK